MALEVGRRRRRNRNDRRTDLTKCIRVRPRVLPRVHIMKLGVIVRVCHGKCVCVHVEHEIGAESQAFTRRFAHHGRAY